MKVYCVFSSYGEGDGYTVFKFECVASSVDKAISIIEMINIIPSLLEKEKKGKEFREQHLIKLFHKDMSIETPYFIGNRKNEEIDNTIGYRKFGGYLIEETELV